MAKGKEPYLIKGDIALNRLHLNTRNPRFEPVADESEAMAQLFKDDGARSAQR